MPVFPRAQLVRPDVWNWFSHSYGDGTAGSFDQTGRMDAIFRQALDVEYTNWRKYGIAGSRLILQGASSGGWGTLWRETSGGKMPGKTFPYTGEGGALAMVFGINDLGTLGGATTQNVNAYKETLRSCISRWRASTIFETTASNTAFGGSWTTDTTAIDFASSNEYRFASTTTPTVTITLPSDYDGSPIALCFLGRPGTNGGTVTFSGTAGVTGTLDTNNAMAAATFSNIPMIKRVTNLTSANAGQTIIATVTTIVGLMFYDCWWIESKSPPPVIVANVAKLPTTPSNGYTTNYGGWTAQQGSFDADVNFLNTGIAAIVSEFDGMVQIADIDTVLGQNNTLFKDGLHPNERGAALCADALLSAVNRLTPNYQFGVSSQMNTPSVKAASRRIPHRGGNQYYCAEYGAVGTAIAGTAGDDYAIPFPITEARTTWDLWGIEVVSAATTAGWQVRIGIVNDLNFTGYPDTSGQELTTSILNTSTTTGLKTANAGGYIWRPDPGMYWLRIKLEVIGTGGTPTLRFINGPNPFMPNATSAGSVNAAGFVGWKLTGQATGAFGSTYPTGAALTTTAPAIVIRRV